MGNVGMRWFGTPSVGILVIGLLGWAGCDSSRPMPATPPQPYRGIKLVAGAIDDPAILPGLASQRGEWSATRGGEVVVHQTPLTPKAMEAVDVVLFRADRLGDLVDVKALVVVPESLTRPPAPPSADAAPADQTAEPPADPVRFADVVPVVRDQVTKYGNERMGLPYGGTALVLVYQREAFEREANRAAAKEAKLALGPPETWEQLDALAKFFQGRDWNGDGSPESGIALALGTDLEGVADATFLARAASLGQHRDQYSFLFDSDTMAPRVDSPPFVEALQGLVALKQSGPPGVEAFDGKEARRLFAEGRAAMLIDRAEQVSSWGDGQALGVAPLPGSPRVYEPIKKSWESLSTPNRPSYLPYGGGWLVGVNARTEGLRREAALDFARYLIGPDIASRVRADRAFPMLAVRSTLLSQGPPDPSTAQGIDARQWADAVTRTLLAAKVVPGLRIPDSEAYLADLSEGRLAALRGEPAENALRKVARSWSERTNRLGVKRQLWHYRRSLNSLITTPEPPAR